MTALYESGMRCIRILQDHAQLTQKVEKAMRDLEESAGMRNALMGLPEGVRNGDAGAVCVQTVLQFYSSFGGKQVAEGPSRNSLHNTARVRRRVERHALVRNAFDDPALEAYCKEYFTQVTFHNLLNDPCFLVGVVGQEVIDEKCTIGMSTILHRLQRIEQIIVDEGWDMRFKSSLGRAWIPTDRTAVLMKVEESWQVYFTEKLCKRGYLDRIAGVKFPGAGAYNNVDNPEQPHDGMASGTPLVKNGDESPSGGVIDWCVNCFSPELRQYFQDDVLPSLNFMADPTSPRSRYIRCESVSACSTNPVYFQVGHPPRAKLFRAMETTKFGDMLLHMSNFIEGERYKFFYGTIRTEYGESIAKEYTPIQKEYDLLYALLGDSSFGYHTDSRHMLYDENVKGWEECFLRVVTFFFQNESTHSRHSMNGAVQLNYRPRQGVLEGARKGEVQHSLGGPDGVHEQGNWTQVNWEHRAKYSNSNPKGETFRRIIFTARATGALQKSGLDKLRQMQTTLPVFGDNPTMYNLRGSCLFYPRSGEDIGERLGEDILQNPVVLPNGTPPVFLGPSPSSKRKSLTHNTTDISISTTRFKEKRQRVDMDQSAVPQKMIQVSERLCELLTSAEGLTALLAMKRRLFVSDGKRVVPFGPCVNLNKPGLFAKIGEFFPSNSVRKYYHLPDSESQRPPWDSNFDGLSSLHLSKRYKAPLEPTADGTGSPIGEMLRIWKRGGKSRKGFAIYLSGGNCTAIAAQGPTVNKAVVVGEGNNAAIVFKTPKRMSLLGNPRNRSLYEVALIDRVLSVWFSGQNLPIELQKDENGMEKCMYGGLYRIKSVEACDPWEVQSIRTLLDTSPANECDTSFTFSSIRMEFLSFLRARHLKCYLVPFCGGPGVTEEGSAMSAWKPIEVSSFKPTYLCFEAGLAFKPEDMALSEHCMPSITELVHSYLRTTETGGGEDSRPMTEHAEERGSCEDGPTRSIMVCDAVATSYDADTVFDILKRLLVGYNMRISWLNIDDDGENISVLRDGEGSRYSQTFAKNALFGFCRILGSNVLANPYPCPFPAGDPKVLYLQKCNAHGYASLKEAREARFGSEYMAANREEVAGFLVESFVTETTGNPVLNWKWWGAFSPDRDEQPRLPSTTDMCEDYISFLQSCTEGRKGSLHPFLQGHYRLDKNLLNIDTFGPILLRVSSGARGFIDKVIERDIPTSEPSNRRHEIVTHLASYLATCMNGVLNIFFAGRILANIEELVSGNPFGPVTWAPFGTGAMYGTRLVDWSSLEKQNGSQESGGDRNGDNLLVTDPTSKMTQLLLENIKSRVANGDSMYGYLYIDPSSGQVHQAINGRELNAVDVDQGSCKVYIFRENEPGGGRTMATNPHVQRRHCFPMKRLTPSTMGFPLPAISLELFRREYMESGIQYIFLQHLARYDKDFLTRIGAIFDLEDGIRCTHHVYTNEFIVGHPIPIHRYMKRTFASRKAWEALTEVMAENAPNLDHSKLRMRVLENGAEGLTAKEVQWYAAEVESSLLPLLEDIMESYGRQGFSDFQFSDTCTIHTQSLDCVNQITAFYHHVDIRFLEGRTMILPLQGESWTLVASENRGLVLKDDSSDEFHRWKATLCQQDSDDIDKFMKSFRQYAKKYHNQTRLNIYKLIPGRAMLFDSTRWVHASIVPKQPMGKPRIVLLSHRLDLY